MTEKGPHEGRLPLGHVAEWEDLAVDYVAGRLQPHQRTAIELHLGECESCAAEIDGQRLMADLLSAVPLVPPPSSLESSVLEAYGEAARAHTRGAVPIGSATGHALRAAQSPAGPPTAPSRQEAPGMWRRLLDALGGRTARRLAPVMAVALLFAVGIAGLSRLSGDDLEMVASPTTAAGSMAAETSALPGSLQADEQAAAEAAPGSANTAAATSDQVATTAGADTARTGVGEGEAGADTTAPPSVGTTVAALAGGEKQLLEAMPAYATPVAYLTLQPAPASGQATARDAASPRALVEQITGLTPLEGGLWLGGPTFAAFTSTETLDMLVVDLRRAGTLVSQADTPPPGTGGQAAAIVESGGHPILQAVGASADKGSTMAAGQPEFVLLVIVAAR